MFEKKVTLKKLNMNNKECDEKYFEEVIQRKM